MPTWKKILLDGDAAPTDADYLVGTANAGLSAEIVVGTTPGGELGGIWASPTVDTIHSGSAHHAAVTLAADADTILSLSAQELGLDTQTANIVFAGPTSGGAADPTFRSLVTADLPSGTALSGIPKLIRNGTIDTVNNTTTFADATEMSFAIAADEIWAIVLHLRYNSGITPDIKIQFTQPTGSAYRIEGTGIDAAFATTIHQNSTGSLAWAGTGGNYAITLHGVVDNGANAGTVQLQFAQNTANASDTSILTETWMLAYRLA